jgi:hypothetical protein
MNTNSVGSAGFSAWLEFLLLYNSASTEKQTVTRCVYFRSVTPDTVSVSV